MYYKPQGGPLSYNNLKNLKMHTNMKFKGFVTDDIVEEKWESTIFCLLMQL